MQPTFYVWARWDAEAKVWYTAEASIRGLCSEAATLEKLRRRLKQIIPDFLEDEMPPSAILRVIAESDDELIALGPRSAKGAGLKGSDAGRGSKISVGKNIRSRHLANKILEDAGIGKKF
jgi:hypothetical protein